MRKKTADKTSTPLALARESLRQLQQAELADAAAGRNDPTLSPCSLGWTRCW